MDTTAPVDATGPLEGLEDTSMFRSGFPHLPHLTDALRVGELRSLIAQGDLLAARSIIPQIEHEELPDTLWEALHEQTHWLQAWGWCAHVFGDRACLAYYDPEGNGHVPQRHSLALTFEVASRLLHTLGRGASPSAEYLAAAARRSRGS